MLQPAKELLRLMTERVPPQGPARHSLTLEPDGTMTLTVMAKGKWAGFRLNGEGDLDKEPAAIVEEICAFLRGQGLIEDKVC